MDPELGHAHIDFDNIGALPQPFPFPPFSPPYFFSNLSGLVFILVQSTGFYHPDL
jgi:hypothetical protein